VRRTAVLAAALAGALGLAGCGRSKSETETVKVVATIPPLASLAREVGGERVEVAELLPAGASPHTFEPVPSLARTAAQARLAVRVGLGLDHWADDLLPDDVPVVTAGTLDGMKLVESEGTANPHVWLDPLYAKLIAAALARELTRIDPKGKTTYERNLNRCLKELDSLHARIAATVERFPSKSYVALHPAWVYFALRYGLERVALIAPAGKEPTPKNLKEVIEAIKRTNARAVFAEPQLSSKAAEVVAEEAGVKVIALDPLGKPGESYISLMERNLRTMAEAMGAR